MPHIRFVKPCNAGLFYYNLLNGKILGFYKKNAVFICLEFIEMVSYYISLRLKQFARFFSFNGIHPFIGMIILFLLFTIVSVAIFQKLPYAVWVYLVLALFSLLELQPPMMNAMLRHQVRPGTFFKAKLLENILIVIPFVVFLGCKMQWGAAALLLLIVVPYSYYSFSLPKAKLRALPSPFPAHAFEYHNMFRMVMPVYVIYLLLLVVGVISGNFYVMLVPFFLLLFVMQMAYGLPEDVSYIWLYRCTAARFLQKKLLVLLLSYSCTFLPFLLTALIFYTSSFGIAVLCFITGLIALTGALFIKYQFYPSVLVTQITQLIFFGFAVSAIASPPVFIIILLFIAFSYARAKRNLKSILQC